MHDIEIPTLSTGEPSTLGVWLKLTSKFFGADSPATKFWEEQLADSEANGNGGADEGVIADEGQCMYLNFSMHSEKRS